MENIFTKADEIRKGQGRGALCIVVGTSGSTPRKEGAKMIVYADGTIYGTIGGGSIEKEVAEKALKLIASGKAEKCSFGLEQDLGMQCGGRMEVYIEPINPLFKLFIFGAGHVGKALAGFAKELDFSVTLTDPREDIFEDSAFQQCNCLNKDYFEAITELPFDENTYIVIVTPNHQSDEDILAQVAIKAHAYLGMIGSERKVATLKKRFLQENILSKEQLDSIDMPIGIKFKAETPQEIAISILAKMIDVRNSL